MEKVNSMVLFGATSVPVWGRGVQWSRLMFFRSFGGNVGVFETLAAEGIWELLN